MAKTRKMVNVNQEIRTLEQCMQEIVKNGLRLVNNLSKVETPQSNVRLQISEIGVFNNHVIRCIFVNGMKCLTLSDVARHGNVAYDAARKALSCASQKGPLPLKEGSHFIYINKTEFNPLNNVRTNCPDVQNYLHEILSAPGKEVMLLTPRGVFRLSASFRSETKDAWMEWLAMVFETAVNNGNFEQKIEAYFTEKYEAPAVQIGDPSRNNRCCTGELVESRAETNVVKALISNHIRYQIGAKLGITIDDILHAGLTVEEVRTAWGYIPFKIEPDFFFLNVLPLTVCEYWGGMDDTRYPNYVKKRVCKEKIYATLRPNPLRLIDIEPNEANDIPFLIKKIKDVMNISALPCR